MRQVRRTPYPSAIAMPASPKELKSARRPASPAASLASLLKRSGLTLERLRVLLAVSEAGSLIAAAGGDDTRASQYCHQLRALESFFEFKLTRRQGKVITLNAAGEALARNTREFLGSLDDFTRAGRSEQSCYRIGAGEALLQWIVVPGLARLAQSAPRPVFHLANLQNHQIALALDEMTLDFGLLRANSVRPPLCSQRVGIVEYVFCLPPTLARPGPPPDWLQIARTLPLAVHLENTYAQRELDNALANHGIRPLIGLHCDTFPTAMAALRTGAYATLMLRFPGAHPLPQGVEIVPLPCLDHLQREIHLAWNPRLLAMRPSAERLCADLLTALAWQDR